MAANSKPNKLAFLSMTAPPGYVAGLGRGASGFTTRSDIGPARAGPSADIIAAAKARKGEADDEREEEDADQYQDPENETGLFAGAIYERDDEEADKIWEGVDKQMDERRRKYREAREKAEIEALRQERPKIQAQFADLKRGLSTVTEDEWAALPEAGNLTGKRRKAAAARESKDKTYNAPDSILIGNRDRNQVENSVVEDGTQSTVDGGVLTSLTEIGEARNKIFSHQLDQASSSSSVSGSASTIDPKGYLTELSSVVVKTDTEIGDIKKARGLLDSVIKTNPKHAPGWIAAARVEEVAGKMASARKIIAQGCIHCKGSEDVWLENARLNTNANARVILANAVAAGLTQSVKIWLKAAELENDPESKKRVFRKSLEYLPNSTTLWKELVNLEENPEDARILLSGAVAAVPTSVELWLTLARLSTPEDAKKVLNQARKSLPTSSEIWIAAGRLLEETDADESQIDKTMSLAVSSLRKAGAVIARDQWLKEAERVEKEGSPLTCAAIIKATIHLDVEEEDRRTVWVEDAQAALDKGCVQTARAILAHCLQVFNDKESIWKFAADIEKKHGTRESLEAILERAVARLPRSQSLWLLLANEKRLANDVLGARDVLERAFARNMGSEEISLAAAKLEAENGQKLEAGRLLERARQEVGSARVWMKSAVFERNEKRPERALELVEEAIVKFPSFAKLHMMLGQLLEEVRPKEGQENIKAAREALSKGLKACPNSIDLWLLSSRLEERAGLIIRARAILEKARISNPRNDRLWAESAGVEERSGSQAQFKSMISRGLQECPSSGLLWTLSIWSEPKASRKTRSADALKRTGDDCRVISSVARLFWNDRKIEQARKWFERSVKADPDWGDGWCWWYKFETQHGNDPIREGILKRCKEVEPRHGEEWQKVRKNLETHHLTVEQAVKLVAEKLQITT
ncbi:hypothetical protein IE53DRAFT_162084 [Violaceomyces palustris]|uniref:Uncharacterized protein n=1 Tax=Violaceomyces palustris TaxID=1673888 RepID=A0ACD0NTI0_9BASI|nr:hypothetical protein IE53DRAFT_162084 [Violaceomyces palustris]